MSSSENIIRNTVVRNILKRGESMQMPLISIDSRLRTREPKTGPKKKIIQPEQSLRTFNTITINKFGPIYLSIFKAATFIVYILLTATVALTCS